MVDVLRSRGVGAHDAFSKPSAHLPKLSLLSHTFVHRSGDMAVHLSLELAQEVQTKASPPVAVPAVTWQYEVRISYVTPDRIGKSVEGATVLMLNAFADDYLEANGSAAR